MAYNYKTKSIKQYLTKGKNAIDVIFRVSNNNVAFKYKVYPQKETLAAVIKEEASGFLFPAGTTTFLSAQSKAMVGWERTMPSYEIPYVVDAPVGENGQGEGYTFPCLFRQYHDAAPLC